MENIQNPKKNDDSGLEGNQEEAEEYPPRFLYPMDQNMSKILVTFNHLYNEV